MDKCYHPLVMKFFTSGKSFRYDVPDLSPILSINTIPVRDGDWIPSILLFRIKGLDYKKDVAELECVTACELDGHREWVSLNRLLEILEEQEED